MLLTASMQHVQRATNIAPEAKRPEFPYIRSEEIIC